MTAGSGSQRRATNGEAGATHQLLADSQSKSSNVVESERGLFDVVVSQRTPRRSAEPPTHSTHTPTLLLLFFQSAHSRGSLPSPSPAVLISQIAMEAATSMRAESERERASQGEAEGRVERARKKHEGLLGDGVVGSKFKGTASASAPRVNYASRISPRVRRAA